MCCTFTAERRNGTRATILLIDDGKLGAGYRTRFLIDSKVIISDFVPKRDGRKWVLARMEYDDAVLDRLGFDTTTFSEPDIVECAIAHAMVDMEKQGELSQLTGGDDG